ncbi:class A beta-lactamase-related serine hydrolase [Erythrobacteraceae bacterium WH01K]|nr:class A beta-lactamase-related serine hydrolase [Erythrobacteraceae bacterium WH01K]
MKRVLFSLAVSLAAFTGLAAAPASAQTTNLEAAFDNTFGTEVRAPQSFSAVYDTALERRIAQIADGSDGRIGVAALDLSTGEEVMVLADQRFPMASTSKIAVAATFLEGAEQGRWSLSSEFPLLIPLRSAKYSSPTAPVRKGNYMAARDLIEIMITRSSNTATDALLDVVGGPRAVNAWAYRNGFRNFSIDRDIATLVRDDGEYDPATYIDMRDSATPRDIVRMLAALNNGGVLSDASRSVILGSMSRTRTGKRRIPALMPAGAEVMHKTGSLNNTSSDVGIIRGPNGRSIAVAIYVTGQGAKLNRERKIAEIARALYDGMVARPGRNWTGATYPGG